MLDTAIPQNTQVAEKAIGSQETQPTPANRQAGAGSASRAVVIGLDGATWSIAQPLMATGRMPNLARLTAGGAAGPLASTVPPISAAAWVTFLTGQNPGRHGVYQFRKFDIRQYGGYRDEFTTSRDYAGRSFLELASQRGRRVASIGVPMTYPPFPVNGFLVSGFPRPFGPQAQVYPPEMAAELGRWDEMPDNFNFSLSPAKTVEASDYWVQRTTQIALDALRREPWDMLLVVWNSTDTIPHLYWKYTDPSFPAYDATGAQEFGQVINHQYEMADREIGRLLAALPDPDNTTVLVMSDHGMGPHPHRNVHLNAWLAAEGLLAQRAGKGAQANAGGLVNKAIGAARRRAPIQWRQRLRERLPDSLKVQLYARHLHLDRVDWPQTQAYRMKVFPTVEGVVINVQGRQPEGVVEPGDPYEALRDRIIAGLADLRDPETGALIVNRASRREDLFEGPHLDEIPDILVELNHPYQGGANLNGALVTAVPSSELSAYSANHWPLGLWVLAGPRIRAGAWIEGARIEDLAPTLMHAVGLPVASWMDGKVLVDAFEPSVVGAVTYADYDLAVAAGGALSRDEEAAIRQQLAGLGYLRE